MSFSVCESPTIVYQIYTSVVFKHFFCGGWGRVLGFHRTLSTTQGRLRSILQVGKMISYGTILLDLFSDLSAFYPSYPFQGETSVSLRCHVQCIAGVSRQGKYGNSWTKAEESNWQGQQEHMEACALILG